MTAKTMPVQIPQSIYRRLERLAEISHQPLENVVERTLKASVPPLPDDVPEEMRDDLLALEAMDADDLWQVARSMVSPERQDQHRLLLEKNRLGTITEAERTVLAHCVRKLIN